MAEAPEVGKVMKDGTVYAGISPDSGKEMFTTPADARTSRRVLWSKLTYTFCQAYRYASKLNENDHKDWRIPTKGELSVMFQNRAAIGGFDEKRSYWASEPGGFFGPSSWSQRFSDGRQSPCYPNLGEGLRCVR